MMNWNALHDRLREEAPSLELRREEPMSRHTTFRVGGPAALMALPRGEEVKAVIETAFHWNVVPLFLGNGSNLLVSDSGYDGFVVKLGEPYSGGEVCTNELMAGGGMPLSRAANLALEHGLTGLEWAAGIPGTIGGAVSMNAGAYGGEMKQVVQMVRVMDKEGEILTLDNDTMEFGYRTSIIRDRPFTVLGAVLKLNPGNKEEIGAKMEELMKQRKSKQPLEYPSAGSTFKRPEGHFAGKLIMDAGLRGYRIGGAQVSEKHCGFVVNTGGATAADIRELIEEIRERVLDRFHVRLEPEVIFLGDF